MTPRSIRRAAERKAAKAQRARLRAAKEENNSLALSAARLTPPPSCASLEEACKASRLQPASENVSASAAQLAANRANAKRSTGPTSALGKSISSRNHFSYGLTVIPDHTGPFQVLPSEDQAAYDASLAAFQSEWKPATATEHTLVQRLATHDWLHNRALRLQNEILAGASIPLSDPDLKQFQLFARYATTHHRAFNKSLSDLMRLRSFQLREQNQQAALELRTAQSQAKIQNGFESQKRHAEAHAIKMQIAELRLEAQKIRNGRLQIAPQAAAVMIQKC